MPDPAHAQEPAAPMVRVLEADPDLGADLDRLTLASATRELIAPLVEVGWTTHGGHWGPTEADARLGLLVLDGLLLREVRVLRTTAGELLGAGDVLRPADVDGELTLPAPAEIHWTVLAPLTVAALDGVFMAAACRYPAVLARVTGRAVARAKALALHDAVTNLRHVETRLLVQFWHLAERWGRVGRDGVTVTLPLTHELLAKLVGAARPSVTTALGRLSERGQLTRDGDGWMLSHDSRLYVIGLT
jgi:CRP/FNR family transcriptional regulator, cyclic AMP receptor protein